MGFLPATASRFQERYHNMSLAQSQGIGPAWHRQLNSWLMTRKYRLTFMFGIAALLVIVIAALFINYAIGRITEDNLIRIAEKDITAEAVDMLSLVRKPSDPLTLETLADPSGLPRRLPLLVQRYSVVKIDLLDPLGQIIWSTNRSRVGELNDSSAAFKKAIEGSIASRFLSNKEVADLDGVRHRLSLVETSLPVRDPASSQVIGVMEITRNVTEEVPFLIGATRSSVLQVTAATMAGLFLALLIVVIVADMTISRSKRREQATLESQLAERKQAAEALLQSNQRLEEVVVQLKKTQQQIIQQERLRALGEMSSGIAHDFNNALMPILGFTSLLISQPEMLDDKGSVKDQLQIINTAAEDAATVVKRLQEFYRQRDVTDQFTAISLNELVNQAMSLTQAKWKGQAQAKGINVQVETRLAEIPSVMGNAPEIREALINLILNAVDAMSDGGTISIQTRLEREQVALVVSDTGSGMTEEVRRRCLEPFFTTKGAHGTGMGLAMVYGTVQRHRGAMDIQSALGQGTSFLIHLPVHSESANDMNGEMELPESPNKLHVLVVDDEPVVQQILVEFLSCDGHTVETAANGQEGLEKFRAGAFDLVLTDQAMPQMNGDQLAVAIKGLAPEKPIILVTGFADIMAATNERPEAVDLILGKPLTISELRQALVKVMDTVASPKLALASAA